MKSFLGRLISYSPRPTREPREDFFTEVLAGVLTEVPDLIPAITRFGYERGKLTERWEPMPGVHLEVETQFGRFKNGRPDMAILQGGEPALLIENKLWAGFSGTDAPTDGQRESQIPYYVREAVSHGWPAKVLLISMDERAVPPVSQAGRYLGNLLWSDVYEAISSRELAYHPRSHTLTQELLRFMEDLGMTPPTPFRFGDADAYSRYRSLRDRMRAMLVRLAEPLSDAFEVEVSKPTAGEAYDYFLLKTRGLSMDLGLVFGGEDESNRPMWLLLHIRPESPDAAKAHEALAPVEESGLNRATWPGKCAFPTNEQMSHFLGAWDWEGQVKVGNEIVVSWLGRLVEAGLVKRKG